MAPVVERSSLRAMPSRREAFQALASDDAAISADACDVLIEAYAALGGICDGDHLAERMRVLHGQPLSMLARLIVQRELITVERRGSIVVPLFQLDGSTWLPRPAVRRVVRELRDVYNDLELAWWFVQANPLLAGRSPVVEIEFTPEAVLDAARAEHFIARW